MDLRSNWNVKSLVGSSERNSMSASRGTLPGDLLHFLEGGLRPSRFC